MTKRLDCLIIGAGPAGLTAAVYLRRFRRTVEVVHSNASRASLIPLSHNYPGFSDGISGPQLLSQLQRQAQRYGAPIREAQVMRLMREDDGGFVAQTEHESISARKVLLATGVIDIEPQLPNVEHAILNGYVRHCPICDAYEVIDQKIALIGHGSHAVKEALFLRHYTPDITLLTLGDNLQASPQEHALLQQGGISVVQEPVAAIFIEGKKICALRTLSGKEHRFDTMYSALGARNRAELGIALGANHDEDDALIVDEHLCTSVPGLYAAGDVVSALNQMAVAVGHAAIASTHIHNMLRDL